MATIYPTGIDNNVTLPQTIDLVTPVVGEVTNVLRDAIIAIEAELGIDPSREYGTVRARLDAMELGIGGLGGGIDIISKDSTPIVLNATQLNFVGPGVEVIDAGSGVADIEIYQAIQVQESLAVGFLGDTSFTLSQTPLDSTAVKMFINGLKQRYGSDYTVLGPEVTYSGDYQLNVTDEVEFWYLVSGAVGGGSGGGAISILDEGITVDANTTTINFIGVTVQAVQNSPGVVNVFIPPPEYLSHWNTSDGSNGSQAVTESISRSITRIATPAGGEGSPFRTNGWAGTNQSTSINNIVNITSPGNTTGFGGDSTITVDVYSADGSTLLATYTTPSIITNGVNTSGSGHISVTITNYGADGLRFRANALISVDIDSIFDDNSLEGGRYHIEVTHVTDSVSDGSGPYTYIQPDVFFDHNATTPSIDSLAISETVGNILTKHLSGIEYYILGSSFTVDVTDIDQHNRNTSRVSDSLLLRGPEYGLPNLDQSPFGVGSANFIGWTNNHNQNDVDYQRDDWDITAVNYRYIGPTGNITSQVRDTWNSSSIIPSSDSEILIDTYGITSTNLVENFDDENRRQDSTFNSGTTAGNWVSTDSLISGEAAVFNSRLMAPSQMTFVRSDGASTTNTDWSSYKPDLGGANPDYTGLTAPVNYYRSFVDTGVSRSSFSIVFSGTFIADATTDLANSDLQITIYKIGGLGSTGAPPTNTQPLFVHGSGYNFALFDDGATNGQIRLGSSSGNIVQCTFGGFNMEDGVFCHININNALIRIDSIAFTFN